MNSTSASIFLLIARTLCSLESCTSSDASGIDKVLESLSKLFGIGVSRSFHSTAFLLFLFSFGTVSLLLIYTDELRFQLAVLLSLSIQILTGDPLQNNGSGLTRQIYLYLVMKHFWTFIIVAATLSLLNMHLSHDLDYIRMLNQKLQVAWWASAHPSLLDSIHWERASLSVLWSRLRDQHCVSLPVLALLYFVPYK
jgi:hypothetical protein